MRCPRCSQETPEGLDECASCGVLLSRYRGPRVKAPAIDRADAKAIDRTEAKAIDRAEAKAIGRAEGGAVAWLGERMFEVPPAEDGLTWLRCLFLAFLLVWWLRLLFSPVNGEALMGSFLHWIHIPFHEAGHFVFQPFGRFLHILGGTLGQLLVPAIVIAAFLRESNPFGAAVGAWWLGASFLDCAPYINDARDRVLMLLSGETGQEDWEGHDWYQILSRLGWLRYDHVLARLAWGLGALLMAAALAWAAWVLWRQWGSPGRGKAAPC